MNRKDRPQYRAVVLYRDRLIYDVNYESWKISKTRIDDKTMQSELSTDEEADMFLERQFNTAFSKIKENLLFCLDRFTKGGDTATNKLPMKEDNDAELETVTNDNEGYTAATHVGDGENTQEESEAPKTEFRPHYTFGFKFSPYWQGTAEQMMTNMHNYVRCFTLSEWFSLVKPDEAANYLQYADKYLADLVSVARQERMDGIMFML